MKKLDTLQAGYFKAHCLELMDIVAQNKREILITKRGQPVAKLVPVEDTPPASLWGAFKNELQSLGDIVTPIDEVWDADS